MTLKRLLSVAGASVLIATPVAAQSAASAKSLMDPALLCRIASEHGFSGIPVNAPIGWRADRDKPGVWSCAGAAHESVSRAGSEVDWVFEMIGDMNGANTITISTSRFPWNGVADRFLTPLVHDLLAAAGERDSPWMTRWAGGLTIQYLLGDFTQETLLGKMVTVGKRPPIVNGEQLWRSFDIEFDLRSAAVAAKAAVVVHWRCPASSTDCIKKMGGAEGTHGAFEEIPSCVLWLRQDRRVGSPAGLPLDSECVANELVYTSAGTQDPRNGQSPRELVLQLVEQLRTALDDNRVRLRERIIRLAREIKPALAVPEEAERRIARGSVAFKSAKSTQDYYDAAAEFEQATVVAPWDANGYYNLGIARGKAGDFDGAAASLKLYLLAAPDATDAKEAKTLMYEMEYKQDQYDKAIGRVRPRF